MKALILQTHSIVGTAGISIGLNTIHHYHANTDTHDFKFELPESDVFTL